MKSINKKKVFVGLSGGVDSAVGAALLKAEGYYVVGVFIKAWTPDSNSLFYQNSNKTECAWKEDRRSAMKVAAVLDIPFITLNLEKEYKKEVVDCMIKEYKEGKTPNPDVMCNRQIKFGHFLKFALKNGANYVATGHYARNKLVGVNYRLLEGKDKNKDQSYFLWTLTQSQLKHILFPIGHLQKSEVRKLAGKFNLPQATRKDSQGLCFLGKIDMKEFLKEFAGAKRGKVLNENGQIIGEHNGALLYTIGERHGFTITSKTTQGSPVYVVAKDIENNTITVSPKKDLRQFKQSSQMLIKEVKLENINLIGEIPNNNLFCRVRYRQEKIPCKVIPKNLNQQSNQQRHHLLRVIFDRPEMGVSPGQSLVLYNGEVCLGGGIIAW